MTKYLVVRFLSQSPDYAVQWAIVDAHGHLLQRGEQPLATLRDSIPAAQLPSQCVLLVPGEKVRITEVRIPSTNAKKIHQALPFAVEETIADELETTHLATGPIQRQNNGWIDVAIVRHQLIIDWIDLCHQYDLTPHYIIPDSLCVPWEANSWTFFYDQQRVLVRTATAQAQVVNTMLAPMLLQEMVAASNRRQDVIVKPQINFFATELQLETFADWRKALPATPDHDQRDSVFREDVFQVMAAQAVTQLPQLINLRQGGYRVPVDGRSSARPWRQAAMIAAFGTVVFAAVCLGKAFWFERQRVAVEQQAVALYKQIYPEATRIFNPRRQMESTLLNSGAAVDGTDEFSEALQDITEVIAASQNAEVYVQSLLFNAEQADVISLSMTLSQADALDEMRERLAETDLRLDVGKTTPDGNVVAVDLRLLRGQ